MPQRFDIAQEITDAIIARLEAGTKPWEQPWSCGPLARPLRSCGTPYRGMNILLLWMKAQSAGFTSPYWMTYRQAALFGAQVRQGEKATHAVFYKKLGSGDSTDTDAASDGSDSPPARSGRVLRSFAVFNADQIDGLPARYQPAPTHVSADDPVADQSRLAALLEAIPIPVIHEGARAYYRPSTDMITLPPVADFTHYHGYASTRLHESAHGTGHKSRLARDFTGRFGSEGYGFEELVAELASAIFGAAIGLPVSLIDNHASYVASWLKVLKSDRNAVLHAAARAQDACDMMLDWMGIGACSTGNIGGACSTGGASSTGGTAGGDTLRGDGSDVPLHEAA